MRKRIIWFVCLLFSLICIFTVSAVAADMTEYCTSKVTLVDGTEREVYFQLSNYQGTPSIHRDTIYASPDKSSTIAWGDVKILDMREMQVFSQNGVIPKTLQGTGCNSSAVNVEVVYLAPTLTELLNSSFTSGWKSLKTVYIPKSLEKITGSFGGSPVEEIIFEKGSELKKIHGGFTGCKKLSKINLEDTQLVEIDLASGSARNAFSQCSSLTEVVFPETLEEIGYNAFYQSGLSGTIAVPNSVVNLGPGAFLATNIQTLILGDGVNKLGHNFLSFTADAEVERSVYLSAGTIAYNNRPSEIWNFSNKYNVTFYVVGKDFQAVVDLLKTAPMNSSYYTIDDSKIVTGLETCDVFYGGKHLYEDGELSCAQICQRCELLTYTGIPHTMDKKFVFAGEKYLSACTVVNYCEVCSYAGDTLNIDPMFIWLGYTYSELHANDKSVQMSQGFKVDKEALALYESESGESLKFGLVAARVSLISPISIQNGNLVANDSVIAEMSNTDYSIFSLKITGITLDKLTMEIIFSGYVYNGSEITYLSGGKALTAPVGISYDALIPKEN